MPHARSPPHAVVPLLVMVTDTLPRLGARGVSQTGEWGTGSAPAGCPHLVSASSAALTVAADASYAMEAVVLSLKVRAKVPEEREQLTCCTSKAPRL